MFNEELVDNITDSITNLDTRVGELERKETLTKGDGIGPFRYELHVDINGDGDFTSVKDACDHIASQSSLGVVEWLAWIHPGEYDELPFSVPTFTTLWGLGGDVQISPTTSNLATNFITIPDSGVTLIGLDISASLDPTSQDVFVVNCTGGDLVLDDCRFRGGAGVSGPNVAGVIKCSDTGDINFSDCQFTLFGTNAGLQYVLYIAAGIGNQNNFIRSCRIWRESTGTTRGIFFSGSLAELYLLETSILPESTDIFADTGATVYLRATNYDTGGGAGTITYMYAAGSGSVTSVALSAPSIFTVSGSPVTGSGTLALTLATQVANRVFAGPASGADAAPTFRALVADDIPNLSAAKITSGILTAPRGGTGFGTYAVGDILYADTTTSLARLADVATGNALISGGIGVAPAWGKIDVTSHITGIVPPANGGTGVNNGTNALTIPATGTAVLGGGSGANTRLAIWTGANAISSDAGLTYASNLLTVAGRYILVGGATSLTTLVGSYPGDLAIVEITRNVAANTDVSYSVLALTHEQEGTDRVIGSIFFGNREISATNKRAAVIEGFTGVSSTAAGSLRFYTLKSTESDVSESMRITENHAVWIGRAAGYSFTLAAEGQIETQSDARIGGTLAVLNTASIAASAPSVNPLLITSDQPTSLGAAFSVEVYTSALAPGFFFSRATNTLAAPQAVSSASPRLLTFQARGHDGTNFVGSSQILFEVDGTVSSGAVPGRLRFYTANSAGDLTEAIRIDSAQFVGIGSTNPLVKLHMLVEDAATSAVSELSRVDHNTTGTAAAGYGTRLLYRLESSTTQNQNAIALESAWTVATHATRTSEYRIYSVTNAGALAEVARFDGGGGATPAAANTGLMIWDVDNNTLERVTVGAAGSGGVGFKVLRIPN